MMAKRRRVLTAIASVLAVAVIAFFARHLLARVALETLVSAATGYDVRFADQHLGRSGASFFYVQVRHDGQPLFAAPRVEVGYVLRDLLPGGARRYGLTSVTLTHPVITIVRFAHGGYNVSPGGGGGGSTGGAPLRFALRIRDGAVHLDDQGAETADLREQVVRGIAADGQIDSTARSMGTVDATLVARPSASAPLATWPLHERTLIDVPRGIALARLHADALPLRGIVAFFVHTHAFRLNDGVVRPLDVHVFAANIGTANAPDIRVTGGGEVRGGEAAVAAIVPPLRNLHGRLFVLDDGIWSTGLAGTLGGVSLHARGGIYGLHAPEFRLGISGTGDLRTLRGLFAFSRAYDVGGAAQIETVLEGPVGAPLVHTAFSAAALHYDAVPIERARGRVDYYDGAVTLDGVRARVGGADLSLGGRFLLGEPLDTALVLGARGIGRGLPYVQNIAPGALVEALAVIAGAPHYHARGAIGADGGGVTGLGFFHIDERGVGEFGPFAFARGDGSTFAGGFRLDRPDSSSAAWLSVHRFRVTLPTVIAGIPGVHLPNLPPVGGVLDGNVVGGGSPSAFALAGRIRGSDVHVARLPLGNASTLVGGTLTDVRLAHIAVDGPLGHFAGSGAYRDGVFGLSGSYDGTLEALVPLTGDLHGHGHVSGAVAATIESNGTILAQSSGATFSHATIRGVALDRGQGTIALGPGGVRVLAAAASIGGTPAVAAADADGGFEVSAAGLPAAALRGTGLPLQAGTLSLFGRADLRSTVRFDGTVQVAQARAAGFPVGGDARFDLAGSRATIAAADTSLGGTFGTLRGTLAGIGTPDLRYDLRADVPNGNIGRLGADLHVPLRHLDGSFSARMRVRGDGAHPQGTGRISAPEGSYNGLAFRDAHAQIAVAPNAMSARDGALIVGTTRLGVAASIAGRAFSIDVRAPQTNLDDFNDFFDASDTFDGHGRIVAGARSDGHRLVTYGDIALQGLRYQRFPLGDTTARWLTSAQTIRATAGVRGTSGSADAVMTVALAPGDPRSAFTHAHFRGTAGFHGVDLGTWLPAAGSELPILGILDGRATISGRPPALAIGVDVRAHDAHVASYALSDAVLQGTFTRDRLTISRATASLDVAALSASGSLGFTTSAPLALDLRGTTPDAGKALHAFVPSSRSYDVAGSLATDVRVSGTFDHPEIDGGFDLEQAHYFGLQLPRAIGVIALNGNNVTLRDTEVILPHGEAFIAGKLPLQVSPFAIGPASAPVSFDVSARAIDLAQFAPILPAETKLTGMLDGHFGVEGTVGRPRLLGSVSIAKGSYVSDIERAQIRNVNARVSFAGTSIALDALHADVGSGTLDGSGKIELAFGDAPTSGYAVDLRAKGAQLDFPAYGSGRADGSLQLTSGKDRPLLAGTVAVSDATIPFSAFSRSSTASAANLPAYLDPAFAIRAEAGRNVRVRSSIIDLGASGSVEIGGTLSKPELTGTFVSTGGTFSTYNHAFRVQQARVQFDPSDGLVPTLDLRATTRVTNPDPDPTRNVAGSADITVTVTGPADPNHLQIAYSSSPPYSEAQIVGLLLDVPAILGAVNFNSSASGPYLRGAPGESNVLLPPGVTVEQTGTLSFNQEIFSLLNGQFTQRALSPLERFLQAAFGLSDLALTVDYGGGVGYSIRRQLGKRDFYAALSQTLSYPERTNFGLELRPDPFTVVNFSYFRQNGVTSLINTNIPGYESFLRRRLTSVQPLGDRAGFSLTFSKRYP